MDKLFASTALAVLLFAAPAFADNLDVNSFGPWGAAAAASNSQTALTPPARLERLAPIGALTYRGALTGTASGAAVNSASEPLVNGRATVQLNLSTLAVTGKFYADAVHYGGGTFQGYVNAVGIGTITKGTSSYVFTNFSGDIAYATIGLRYGQCSGCVYAEMTGKGTINGPNAQRTIGQLSGEGSTVLSSSNFVTANYNLKR
jgi:hypothetical protein